MTARHNANPTVPNKDQDDTPIQEPVDEEEFESIEWDYLGCHRLFERVRDPETDMETFRKMVWEDEAQTQRLLFNSLSSLEKQEHGATRATLEKEREEHARTQADLEEEREQHARTKAELQEARKNLSIGAKLLGKEEHSVMQANIEKEVARTQADLKKEREQHAHTKASLHAERKKLSTWALVKNEFEGHIQCLVHEQRENAWQYGLLAGRYHVLKESLNNVKNAPREGEKEERCSDLDALKDGASALYAQFTTRMLAMSELVTECATAEAKYMVDLYHNNPSEFHKNRDPVSKMSQRLQAFAELVKPSQSFAAAVARVGDLGVKFGDSTGADDPSTAAVLQKFELEWDQAVVELGYLPEQEDLRMLDGVQKYLTEEERERNTWQDKTEAKGKAAE